MQIGALIRRAALHFGDAPCLTEGPRTLSFREFDALTDQLGNALLDLGLRLVKDAILDVVQRRIEASDDRGLGDARPHGPRAEDGDVLNGHVFVKSVNRWGTA